MYTPRPGCPLPQGKGRRGMSWQRVLAVYAALLLGFAVVCAGCICVALHPAYAARAAAQSTVTLQLPARRGNFYGCAGAAAHRP